MTLWQPQVEDMTSSDFSFQARIIRETEKAFLFELEDQKVWMPKSQILGKKQIDHQLWKVTIPGWLADEKEIEDA